MEYVLNLFTRLTLAVPSDKPGSTEHAGTLPTHRPAVLHPGFQHLRDKPHKDAKVYVEVNNAGIGPMKMHHISPLPPNAN